MFESSVSPQSPGTILLDSEESLSYLQDTLSGVLMTEQQNVPCPSPLASEHAKIMI